MAKIWQKAKGGREKKATKLTFCRKVFLWIEVEKKAVYKGGQLGLQILNPEC